MKKRTLLAASAAIAYVLLLSPVQALAADCQFVLGFATLKALIDDAEGTEKVGECLEDQRFNPANGDALQQTTGGLMVWRKLDNWTAFTNGYMTWINGPNGLENRLNTESFSWENVAPTPTPVPTPAPTPIPDYGDWELVERTDALTKVTKHRMVVEAHTWQDDLSEAPWLGVRCVQGEQGLESIYIAWETHVGKGTDNRLPIRYRFDEKEIVSTEWLSSTTSRATFVRFNDAGNRFYRGLFDGTNSEVAVEVEYFNNTGTGVWRLHGARAAVNEILRRCG